jgi:hypothetical protein
MPSKDFMVLQGALQVGISTVMLFTATCAGTDPGGDV